MTNDEQARFLGLAIRSLIETVACQHLIRRRQFIADDNLLNQLYRQSEILVAKLHAMRKTIAPAQQWLREDRADYLGDESILES